ncbi:MAG: SGNH/GDSL hydrolase family protein, partial [Geminicoccaceae bacterium]
MRIAGGRKWPIALLYVLALALLVEGAGYLIVSAYDNDLGNRSQRHLYSAIRGHELNPSYRRAFDTGGRLIHSAQGFRRDGPIEKEKPAGTFRIFVLGGSALYGIGVQGGDMYPAHPSLANDQTVTFFLERDLNARLRDAGIDVEVEVINAGVTAYQTFQHVLYFYETLYEYQPDMLLFLDGHNDFYNVDPANPIKAYGYSGASMVRALNERRPLITLYVASRYLGQYSYAFKFLEQVSLQLYERYEAPPHNSGQSSRLPDGDLGTALETAAAVGFLRNYKLIEHFARAGGIDYHVFLQPEVVFENDQWLRPPDRTIKATTERLYGPERVELMTRARERFPALFARHGLPYTDIGTIAQGAGARAQLYVDYC